MWIGVLWAGLRVAMWITHVGGKFRWPARKVTDFRPILADVLPISGNETPDFFN